MEFSVVLFLQMLIIVVAGLSIWRFGLFSYPGMFVSNCLFYFIAIPWAADDAHVGLNFALSPTPRFLICALMYQVAFLLGLLAAIKPPYLRPDLGTRGAVALEAQSFFGRIFWAGIFSISTIFVGYSLITRNIFEADRFLFTMIGFDMFSILYLYNRERRNPLLNIGFFVALIALYLYSGFRYRIALMIGAELSCLNYRKVGYLKVLLLGGVLSFALIWFSAFAAVRNYGSFSLPELTAENFDVKSALVSSGEQTVTRVTMTIADGIENIDLYGMEPATILLTHFIPSAIYPDKPRAQYLESYFVVGPELRGTGAAMHDMAQFLGMFGLLGLPFVSFAAGYLWGRIYAFACKMAPNRYVVAGLVTLFGFLMPTRGYLAQQMTWALTFVVILFLLKIFGQLGKFENQYGQLKAA